jgi:hypothetical protein
MDPRSTNFASTYSPGTLTITTPADRVVGDLLVVFLISIPKFWGMGLSIPDFYGRNTEHIWGEPAPAWPKPPTTGSGYWPGTGPQPPDDYPRNAPQATVATSGVDNGQVQWTGFDATTGYHNGWYVSTWSNLGSEEMDDEGATRPGSDSTDQAIFTTWPFIDTWISWPYGLSGMAFSDLIHSITLVARPITGAESTSYSFTLNNPCDSDYDYRALAFVFPPTDISGNYWDDRYINDYDAWTMWEKSLAGEGAWWPATGTRTVAPLSTSTRDSPVSLATTFSTPTVAVSAGTVDGGTYFVGDLDQFRLAIYVGYNTIASGTGKRVKLNFYWEDHVNGGSDLADFVDVYPNDHTNTNVTIRKTPYQQWLHITYAPVSDSSYTGSSNIHVDLQYQSQVSDQYGHLFYPSDRSYAQLWATSSNFTIPTLSGAVAASRAVTLVVRRFQAGSTNPNTPGAIEFHWSTGHVDVRSYTRIGDFAGGPWDSQAWTVPVPAGATSCTIQHVGAVVSSDRGAIEQIWFRTTDTAQYYTGAIVPAYYETDFWSWPLDPESDYPYVVDPSSPYIDDPTPPPEELSDEFIMGIIVYGGPSSFGDPSTISMGDPSASPPISALPVLHRETWTVGDYSKAIVVVGTHATPDHAVLPDGTGVINLQSHVFTADGGPINAPYPVVAEPWESGYDVEHRFGFQLTFRCRVPGPRPVAVPARLATIVG